MHFTKLVPTIFYADIHVGLRTFIDCLEFTIGHDGMNMDYNSQPYVVLDKDGLSVMLIQDKAYAEKDHPEFRLVTKNIEEVYARVSSAFPEMLHPNLREITLRPWGAKEFALLDGQIGIRVQEW